MRTHLDPDQAHAGPLGPAIGAADTEGRGQGLSQVPSRSAWPDNGPAAPHAPERASARLVIPIWLFLALFLVGQLFGSEGLLRSLS